MATKDYDPKQVVLSLGGVAVEGYADGTFITAQRNNQTFNLVSGASGETVRAKSNDKTGTLEITLLQSSATNDWLSGKMLADEGPTNAGKFSVAMIDKNGTTVVSAVEGWVQQPPAVEYGKELGERTWTIECGELLFLVGGIQ